MDNLVENLIRQYMREKVDLRGQIRKIFPVKKSIFPNSDSKRTSLGDNANYLSITQTGIESNSDDLGMVRRKIMDVFHGRNKVNRVSN